MTRPAWSAKRRPKRTAVSCSSVPDGIPDDVWREIMAEDKPDDEGDDAMTDEQRHDAAGDDDL